ncbi:hypothetical protein SH661x_001017 [Planctomicrobium sp. SH661]|uniref:hypothetical protein n=1 Tax=Planctomicrobium sp. SH661 TaxID=3448124 RepID=UPI003F5C4C32
MKRFMILLCVGAMSLTMMGEAAEAARWGRNARSFNRGYRQGVRTTERQINRSLRRGYIGPRYNSNSRYRYDRRDFNRGYRYGRAPGVVLYF